MCYFGSHIQIFSHIHSGFVADLGSVGGAASTGLIVMQKPEDVWFARRVTWSWVGDCRL